jgi:DNA-binding MarR family transcriptional regulator
LLDLLYFRDDAHIAAWQPYDISGHTWEAFTYVWRGDATLAAELAEQLPYRNYDEQAYASALQDLASRGWIVAEDGRYAVTDEGQALRQEAEEATDRYFDAPWAALEQAEMEQLKDLLGRLAQALKPPDEES